MVFGISGMGSKERYRDTFIAKEVCSDPGAAYIKLGFIIHHGGNIRFRAKV